LDVVKASEPGRAPAAAERDDAGDRVSTEESKKVAAAVAAASKGAALERSAKLSAIEAAVRQGTYKPDPQRIAQEILDDAELAARLQTLLLR
jgi:negative regulator of flagellin synthesis FlgM